jgi:3-oxoacyl-[acyl-carrier-protein] synthase III
MEGSVLFVLGAGFYTPENKLSDQFLLDVGLSNQVGGLAVKDRRTTLPLSLLKEDKNRDLVRSMRDATISCSEMGERAARQALDRAQISVDQIGLVIADCVTPIETTPAESQRVAGRLGLKVPAYDIYSTNGICPAHFSILSKWKKDRVPSFVLCVSTNAPTQRIDYSKGAEGWIFGDGAAACVVSMNEGPGLELLWSDYQVDVSQFGAHSLDTLGYLTCQPLAAEVLRVQFQRVLKSLETAQHLWGNKKLDVVFAASENAAVLNEVTTSTTLSVKYENSIEEFGNMFGTNSFADIGARWDSFSDGQLIGVIVAQGLPGFGAAVFRVRK